MLTYPEKSLKTKSVAAEEKKKQEEECKQEELKEKLKFDDEFYFSFCSVCCNNCFGDRNKRNAN